MKALIFSTGSLGDLLPFVGMGRELQRRGHQVTLFGNGYYDAFAERAGLDFQPLYSADEYRSLIQRDWSGLSGVKLWAGHVLSSVLPVERLVRSHAVPGETVVISLGWMLGTRIARELLDIRLVTIHMQPEPLGTLLVGRGWLQDVRRAVRRLAYGAMADAVFARKLNALRRELGLGPVRRVVTEWWNSPDLVVGMFPDWFQAPAPDWPAQTFLPGFALYEPVQAFEEEPDLEAFLSAGEPPVVFGQGSWIQGAEDYFRSSVAAAQALGLRAILLTPHVEQVPSHLPGDMLHLKFVPYSRVLPRSAAFVHHGGTGSLASGLAAGIPQLVCPRVGDQPANARRLTRLGVAESIAPRHYKAAAVRAALERLLSSPSVAAACARFAEASRTMHTFARIADRVEGLYP